MNIEITFKRGVPATYNDVIQVQIGTEPISSKFSKENIKNCLFPSNEDIVITYNDGKELANVAKGTFRNISIKY